MKHARKELSGGKIMITDLRPRNLHPKAKARIFIAIVVTLLLLLGCVYLLSMTTITPQPDTTTSYGISALISNVLAFCYVIGTILIIFVLWYLMINDCPISKVAKANYDAAHDKSVKGVKLVAALAAAIVSKGAGQSIESVANAATQLFDDQQQQQQQQQPQQVTVQPQQHARQEKR